MKIHYNVEVSRYLCVCIQYILHHQYGSISAFVSYMFIVPINNPWRHYFIFNTLCKMVLLSTGTPFPPFSESMTFTLTVIHSHLFLVSVAGAVATMIKITQNSMHECPWSQMHSRIRLANCNLILWNGQLNRHGIYILNKILFPDFIKSCFVAMSTVKSTIQKINK